jgi:ADP-ribose pyrophosphatase YjhB (NUDIX family)
VPRHRRSVKSVSRRGGSCTNVGGVNGARRDEAGPWRTFGARRIYESPELWVGQVDVELPGGERVWEPVVRLHQSAFMAVLDEQGRVLLVRRHRFIAGESGWELPGGLVDEEEDPATAAARELEDVSGFRVGRAEELIRFRPMAETVDCQHVAFVGREPESAAEPVAGGAQVEWMSLDLVPGLIAEREIWHAATLVALLRLLALNGL